MTQSWTVLHRKVSLASYAAIAAFWLFLANRRLWWLCLLMAAYTAHQFRVKRQADAADERTEVIAARAAFLSQKVMLGLCMILAGWGVWNGVEGVASPVLAVLVVGELSEQWFRKALGADEPAEPEWARLFKIAFLTILVACALVFFGLAWR